MTAAEWPRADPGLERAYRRLLRAYPGSYRRRHGTEIVTTLLEMAEPGQQRPRRSEVWHLIGSGLRQRFRLPSGQPAVWVVAVLAVLIGGGLGSAAGSWAAEQTFADVPSPAQARELLNGPIGAPPGEEANHSFSGGPWWGARTSVSNLVQELDAWNPEPARQRLAADGWQLGPLEYPSMNAVTVDEKNNEVELDTSASRFRAEKDGVAMEVTGFLTEMTGDVGVDLWATGNASLLPLIVAGGLAGMAGGWLLAAALARRLRSAGPAHRRVAGGLATVAVLILALPAVAFYGNVMRAFRYAGNGEPVFTVHSALTPGGYWPFGPGWLNLVLFGSGLVVLAGTVVVALLRSRAATESSPVAN